MYLEPCQASIIGPFTLRENCPYSEFFLVRIFRIFRLTDLKNYEHGHFSRNESFYYFANELVFSWITALLIISLLSIYEIHQISISFLVY